MFSSTVSKKDRRHCETVLDVIDRKIRASPGTKLNTVYVKGLLAKELNIDHSGAEALLSELDKLGFIKYGENKDSLTYIGNF